MSGPRSVRLTKKYLEQGRAGQAGATVDKQCLSGYVAGIIAQKEGYRFGDILGIGKAPQRDSL